MLAREVFKVCIRRALKRTRLTFFMTSADIGGFMYHFSLLGTTWYPFLFDSVPNILRSVAIWLTVAMLITFLICFFALHGERRKKFSKIFGIIAIVYACAVGLLFLIREFIEGGIEPILFYPLLVLIVAIAVSGTLLAFVRNKMLYIITASVCGAALIACFVCMGVHFASNEAAANNGLTNEDVNTLGLYLSALLLIAAIIFAAFFFGRKDKKGFDTRSITFAAVCIAMSFALSYLKIVEMPQGGSITIASLLPLMIYSYMFGTKKGVFAGMIYGILQAFQDTYILHPAQFLLDYPVAFAGIGLAGMFARYDRLKYPQVKFALGAVTAGLVRFLSHFISGIFAFGTFATIDPVWLYSLSYQAAYLLPDLAITLVAGILVFSSKTFVHELTRYSPAQTTKNISESVPQADGNEDSDILKSQEQTK